MMKSKKTKKKKKSSKLGPLLELQLSVVVFNHLVVSVLWTGG